MQLLVDENIALIEHFFNPHYQTKTLKGRDFNTKNLGMFKPQALIIRSISTITAQLLIGSNVGFVGSATIGTDHIEIDALQQRGITVAHAPGCNAIAVAEYVITAILQLKPEAFISPASFTLGVVGYGHIGKILTQLARIIGWQVYVVDPFVQINNPNDPHIKQTTLDRMLPMVDCVSLHVPLTQDISLNPHATHHLIAQPQLALMKPHTLLINSARGAVVKQTDLMADIHATKRPVALDVFEFEPNIPKALLDLLTIATPHIAGYSLEGKANGTLLIYQALRRWQQLPIEKTLAGQLPSLPTLFNKREALHLQLAKVIPQIYPIMRDDSALRATVDSTLEDSSVNAEAFDALRKDYPLRREWAAFGFLP